MLEIVTLLLVAGQGGVGPQPGARRAAGDGQLAVAGRRLRHLPGRASACSPLLAKVAEWLGSIDVARASCASSQESVAFYVNVVTFLVGRADHLPAHAISREHVRAPRTAARIDLGQVVHRDQGGLAVHLHEPGGAGGERGPRHRAHRRRHGGAARADVLRSRCSTPAPAGLRPVPHRPRRRRRRRASSALSVAAEAAARSRGCSRWRVRRRRRRWSSPPSMSTLAAVGHVRSASWACAPARSTSLGFTLLHENVEDELRGRIFAALYTLVRLCVLIAFAVGAVPGRRCSTACPSRLARRRRSIVGSAVVVRARRAPHAVARRRSSCRSPAPVGRGAGRPAFRLGCGRGAGTPLRREVGGMRSPAGRSRRPLHRVRGWRGQRQVDPGRRLADRLGAVLTREPGGTAIGVASASAPARRPHDRARRPGRGAAHGSRPRPARGRGGPPGTGGRPARGHRPLHRFVSGVPGIRAGAAGRRPAQTVGLGRGRPDARPGRAARRSPGAGVDARRRSRRSRRPTASRPPATAFTTGSCRGTGRWRPPIPARWVVVDGTAPADDVEAVVWKSVTARCPDLAKLDR